MVSGKVSRNQRFWFPARAIKRPCFCTLVSLLLLFCMKALGTFVCNEILGVSVWHLYTGHIGMALQRCRCRKHRLPVASGYSVEQSS